MKKRIGTLLTLMSIALVASVITFSPKKNDCVYPDGSGLVEVPESEYNPIFYPAVYSTDIIDEPKYLEQKAKTFDDMGFTYAPSIYRGENVKVAVIDSGINYNHEDFPSIYNDSRAIDNSSGSWLYYSFYNNPSKLNDTHGHGTHVASVIASQINKLGCAGVAPNVDLYVYKVTNTSNGYEWIAIENALQYCIDNDVDIINMSFQAYEHAVSYNGSSLAASVGCSTQLYDEINKCYNAGITLVGAAGNYNTNEPSYPASNNHVISVGSFAQNDKTTKAGFSNTYGIDLVAPGYVSTAEKGSSNAYTTTSGTSFSAPLVTAAIALYKQQNPTATPSQIEAALYASCDPVAGNPDWAGHGTLNVDKFLGLDENSPTSISFTNVNDNLELNVGDTFQLEHSVTPSTFGGGFEYSLEKNNGVLSISDSGEITALTEGVEIVTINPIGFKNINASVYITVNENVVDPYKSVTFSAANAGSGVSSYSKNIVYTDNGFSVTTSKFNNNNKGWDFIKCGDKSNNSVATIDTNNAIDKAINNIEITFDTVYTGVLNSAKVITSTNSSFSSDVHEYSFTPIANSTVVVPITNKDSSLYYRIAFDQNKPGSNGSIAVTRVEYNVNESGDEPETNYTVSFNSNGGSGSMDSQETTGSSYIVPTSAFTPPANKVFDQWALNSASGTKYSAGSTINNITENITLYATWKTGTSPTPDVDGYYSSITETSGSKLLAQLHDLSATKHTYYNGYSSDLNTSNFFKTDPYNSSNTVIRDFYTGAPVKNDCISSGNNGWNREHVWPKNLSNNLWGESGAGADIQHLRPTIAQINNTRGSLKFGELNNSGTAATSRDYNNQTVTGGYYNTNTFQPMPDKKGDVARILMYTYMHYNKPSNIDESATKDSNYFGTLNFTHVMTAANEAAAKALLLTWNEADPVDDIERLRNTEAAKITGCRNPFIDNEAYAAAIWGDTPITTKTLTGITLSGTQKTTFSVGETFTYSGLVVTAHYSGAEDAPVTPTSVSTPDMSTAGQKPITVSYTENGVTKSETYTITVSAVEATSITLNKKSASVKVGNTVTLSVDTWDPTNVTNKTLTWASSDESVATVDNGVVTAVAPGTATITAKTSNNKTDTCTITVPEPQVTDISLEILSTKVRYTAGSSSSNTFTLTATLDAEAGATVTWTSSNTSVIKVVTGGGAAFAAAATEVTGYFETVGTGTSTITATAGGKSATCEVRATLPVKSYRAVANNSSVTYTGSTTSVSCTIYEVYTDNTEAIVDENYSLSTNASTLGAKTASGTYEGRSVSAPVTVTNNGSSASIATSTDASKQAEAWANYFIEMTTTTSTCKASSDKDKLSGLQAVWGTLANEYGYMASLSKSAFCSSFASDKIKEALNHYQFIISKFNKDGVKLTDFVVDGGGNKPASSSRSLLNTMFSFENTGFIVAILSIIGIASIAVFVVYKRRKTY